MFRSRSCGSPSLSSWPRGEEGEDDEARDEPGDDPERLAPGGAAREKDRQDRQHAGRECGDEAREEPDAEEDDHPTRVDRRGPGSLLAGGAVHVGVGRRRRCLGGRLCGAAAATASRPRARRLRLGLLAAFGGGLGLLGGGRAVRGARSLLRLLLAAAPPRARRPAFGAGRSSASAPTISWTNAEALACGLKKLAGPRRTSRRRRRAPRRPRRASRAPPSRAAAFSSCLWPRELASAPRSRFASGYSCDALRSSVLRTARAVATSSARGSGRARRASLGDRTGILHAGGAMASPMAAPRSRAWQGVEVGALDAHRDTVCERDHPQPPVRVRRRSRGTSRARPVQPAP